MNEWMHIDTNPNLHMFQGSRFNCHTVFLFPSGWLTCYGDFSAFAEVGYLSYCTVFTDRKQKWTWGKYFSFQVKIKFHSFFLSRIVFQTDIVVPYHLFLFSSSDIALLCDIEVACFTAVSKLLAAWIGSLTSRLAKHPSFIWLFWSSKLCQNHMKLRGES